MTIHCAAIERGVLIKNREIKKIKFMCKTNKAFDILCWAA